MIKSILSLLSGVVGFANSWLRRKERREHEQAGEDRANLKHWEAVDDARRKMRDVGRDDPSSAVDRLRKGGF